MTKIIAVFFVCISTFSMAQKRSIVMPNGHSLLVKTVIVDKQDKYMYTAESHKCIMWDIKTGKQLYTFTYVDNSDAVHLSTNSTGDKLAILANGKIWLYNTITGEMISESKDYTSFTDVQFSDDDRTIYAVHEGIHFLDAASLVETSVIKSNLDYKVRMWKLKNNKVLLASTYTCQIFDLNTQSQTFSFKYKIEDYYGGVDFLSEQNLVVVYGNNSSVDFYDINTGNLKGSIMGDFYDAAVIPSSNTHEILITGPQASEGYSALDLYSTDTYKMITRYNNTGTLKYHAASGGLFNGVQKKAWLIGYNLISEYNLALKNTTKMFDGLAADLGMDVFSAIEYNYATGTLHLATDDHNAKSVDLFRMVPILHTDLKTAPTGLSISPSGDTAAIFDYNTITIKNLVTGKIIRPPTNIGSTGFLYRNAFFFDNDGKTTYYPTEGGTLMKMNLSTGLKQKVFEVKGFGPMEVDPGKKMLAGFESAYQLNTASVWDLTTGKRIFSKQMETDGEYEEQYIKVSKDRSKVLIAKRTHLLVYSIADNKELVNSDKIGYIDKFGSTAANNNLSMFVSGSSNGQVVAYDGSGNKMYNMQAHTTTIRKIVFSPDDKLYYTISYDNSIKVWEAETGRFIGVLYLFKDSNDYVFMDADGRFDGSQEGIKKVYYVLNQQSLPLDALFEKYYTPNLYARAVAGEKFTPIDVNDFSPLPKIKMTYAAATRNLAVDDDKPSYANTTGVAEITIHAEAEGDAIDEIRLFHNGKIVTLTTRNLIVSDENKSGTVTKKYTLNLLPGLNSFRAVALNSQRTESKPDELDVVYQSSNTAPANNTVVEGPVAQVDKNATMYLIVVGINEYENKSMSLNYALADATAFKEEIEKDAKSVINTVKTYFVTDSKADMQGIEAALLDVQKNAKPEDVFLFYYAGHGVIGKNNEFYLVPTNVSNLSNVQTELEQKGIASKKLQQFAIDIPAQKQLFILDACQSAGAFEAMLSNDANQQKSIAVVARSTGTHWMAASGAQQFANEFASLGHGAFTYVLLEALKGAALNNKMITVNNLKNYLQQAVPEIMKKYHGTPQYPASYGFGNDFPVEIKF